MNTPTVPDGQTPPPAPPQYRDPRYGAYGDYGDYGDYGEFGTAPYPAPQPDSQPYPPRYAQPDALDLPPLDIDTPLPPTVPSTPIARPAPPSAPRDVVPVLRPIPPAIAAPRYPSDQPVAPAARHLHRRLRRFGDILPRQPVVVPAALHPARHAGRAARLLALYHPGAHHSATRPLVRTGENPLT